MSALGILVEIAEAKLERLQAEAHDNGEDYCDEPERCSVCLLFAAHRRAKA